MAEKLNIEAELIGGSAGIFDVEADGVLVFSKDEQGRFPETEEIIAALKSRLE